MAGRKTDAGVEAITLWERLERPANTPRQTLSARRIAAEAVALADKEGLDAVTMRRLASELDVAPMAAYRFVSGKDDLLELMVNEVYADLDVDGDDWRQTLRSFAVLTREMMRRHRWLAQLPPQIALALTPNRLRVVERALASLDGLQLGPNDMMTAVHAVTAYVHGAVGDEVALCQAMEGQGWFRGDETRDAVGPQMRWMLSTGRYPVYERYIKGPECKGDARKQFEAGLELTLDGIAARIAGAAGPST